jgi:hypothetical protein
VAKCIRCGKETELHEAVVPICPACVDERDRKPRPKKCKSPERGDAAITHLDPDWP